MPSRRTASGEFKDVAHPINPEFRNEIQEQILKEFDAGHFENTGASAEDEI